MPTGLSMLQCSMVGIIGRKIQLASTFCCAAAIFFNVLEIFSPKLDQDQFLQGMQSVEVLGAVSNGTHPIRSGALAVAKSA